VPVIWPPANSASAKGSWFRVQVHPKEKRNLNLELGTGKLEPGTDTAGALVELLFWISVTLLVYTYVGYPLLIAVRAAFARRPIECRRIEPTVSLIVAAYNEADRIEQKLANLLALDYPASRLEIIVGSDGSTDDTVARIRGVADARVSVVAFGTRRGKASVLNDLVARAHGEIIVLADARQSFAPASLRALVQPFADPTVGAVSGELMLTVDGAHTAVAVGSGCYWRCEKFIRRAESRVDSTVGATGAIYAIRRLLFEPILPDTILDDVLIPLRIMRRGCRVVFEPRAQAFGSAPASTTEEFTRKVRTIAGNFQLFARERWLLDPRRNRLWFQTVSHKGLRLLLPPLHAAALLTNVALAVEATLYWVLLTAQLLFYTAALSGYVLRHTRLKARALALPYTVCVLVWATVVGFVRYVGGRQTVIWERAAAGGDALPERKAA